MINLTLRQLRYVDALARHGRFGRAADSCAISQPALSMQIKELEEAIGATLFERAARQVRPTPFGDVFIRRAQDILRAVSELEDLALTARDGLGGRLRLGVIPTVAPYLLPTILRDLRLAFQELTVDVRETITPRLIEELSDGELDAAIVALPVSEPALDEVELFVERFVLVRPAGDADRPAPTRADLRGMRLLLLEEGHCFRDQALSFCDMRSNGACQALDGSSLTTLVQLVGAGLGVTLIPEMAVPIETRSAQVSLCRFPPPEPSRAIGMIWRRTSPLAAPLRRIADVVRTAATSPALSSNCHQTDM